jgi:hypothetical protein
LSGIRGLDSAIAGDEFEAVMCSHVCIMHNVSGGRYRVIGDPQRKC